MTSPIKGMYKMNGICIFEQIIVFFFLRSAMELILWDFSSKSGLFPHQSVLLWCVFAYPWVYTFRNIPEFSFKLMPEFLPKRCSIFYQDCKNLFLFLFPKLWLWNAHVTVQNRGFVSFFFLTFMSHCHGQWWWSMLADPLSYPFTGHTWFLPSTYIFELLQTDFQWSLNSELFLS